MDGSTWKLLKTGEIKGLTLLGAYGMLTAMARKWAAIIRLLITVYVLALPIAYAAQMFGESTLPQVQREQISAINVRLTNLEGKVDNYQEVLTQMAGIRVQITGLQSEITRQANWIEKFLFGFLALGSEAGVRLARGRWSRKTEGGSNATQQ